MKPLNWMLEAARIIYRDWVDIHGVVTEKEQEEDIEIIACEIYYHCYKPFYPNDISMPEDCICGPGIYHKYKDCPEYNFGHNVYAYYGHYIGRAKNAEDCPFCKAKGYPCHENRPESQIP